MQVPEVRNGGIRLLQTKDLRYGTKAIRFFSKRVLFGWQHSHNAILHQNFQKYSLSRLLSIIDNAISKQIHYRIGQCSMHHDKITKI